MIAALVLMPFPRNIARADDPQDEESWTKTTEGYLAVTAGCDEETFVVPSGEQRNLNVNVHRYTWDRWTSSPSGFTYVENETDADVDGATVSFSVSGPGSVANSSLTTSSGGNVTNSFTMGATGSIVSISASTSAGLTGSVSVSVAIPEPETWEFVRDESLFMASITTAGSPSDVTAGQTRTVQVRAQRQSWQVWRSNYNREKTEAVMTSPADGAEVTWSVTGEGADGTISGGELQTNSGGFATATFTMGTAASTVRADIAYGSSNTANASVTFVPPVWFLKGTESSYTIGETSVNGSTVGLSPGDQRTVSGTVYYNSWDVWWKGFSGSEEIRNATSVPAPGATVAARILEPGDATIPATATAGPTGQFSLPFTMGVESSTLALEPSGYPEKSVSISFGSVGEIWSHVENGDVSAYAVDFLTSNGTAATTLVAGTTEPLTATVSVWTDETWVSNRGNTEIRHFVNPAPSGVPVDFSVTNGGDGTLSTTSATTDGLGVAAVSFVVGSQLSEVQASIGSAAADSVTVTVLPDPFTWDHTETLISVSMQSSGSTANVPEGETRSVFADVTFESIEVYADPAGNKDYRYPSSGPAKGAAVSFGGGNFVSSDSSTDDNGRAAATFTMGAGATTMRVDVSYASATGVFATLGFSPPPPMEVWTLQTTSESLGMSLSASGASVTYQLSGYYTSSFGRSKTVLLSSGAAGGASVSFSISSGNAVIASSDGSTGTNGVAACTVTAGSEASVLAASASFISSYSGTDVTLSASRTVLIPAAPLDTDGDGYSDADENAAGTDPNDPSSYPGSPPKLEITTVGLADAHKDVSYNFVLCEAGGAPPYIYVLQSGNLPSGVTLKSDGEISGTPEAEGNFSFTVKLSDASTHVVKNFSIHVGPSIDPPAAGVYYALKITATEGKINDEPVSIHMLESVGGVFALVVESALTSTLDLVALAVHLVSLASTGVHIEVTLHCDYTVYKSSNKTGRQNLKKQVRSEMRLSMVFSIQLWRKLCCPQHKTRESRGTVRRRPKLKPMTKLIISLSILFAFGCGFVIGGRSVDKGSNSDFKELLATTILHKHSYDAGAVRALFQRGRIHGPLKDEEHMVAWRYILRCSLIAQDLAFSYLERIGKADTTRLSSMKVSVALAKEYNVLESIGEPPEGASQYEYGNTHPLSQSNKSDHQRLLEIFKKYDDEANPGTKVWVKKAKE